MMYTAPEISLDKTKLKIVARPAEVEPNTEYRSLTDYGDNGDALYIELTGDRYALLKPVLASDKDRIFLDARDIDLLERFFAPSVDVEVAVVEPTPDQRLKKLHVIQRAVVDMIDNDLTVSVLDVYTSNNVAEIMRTVAASDLQIVLKVYTLGGTKVGEVVPNYRDNRKVFEKWDASLAKELRGALAMARAGGFMG